MSVVIPRNTSVPVKKTRVYETCEDNESEVLIEVYEGERARVSDNNLLGSFNLSGLSVAPRGHPLDVCFVIDVNGILTVSAKEKSTGNRNEITITKDKGRLTSQEIKNMIRGAEIYCVEDEKFLKNVNVTYALDDCVYKLRNALKISQQENDKINNAITKATDLLDSNQQSKTDVLENHLKVLENIFQRIKGKSV